jgi:hypothetical protein
MTVKHYIFVAIDAEDFSGASVAANDIAMGRIEKGLWPLFARTRCRRLIKAGDKVLIYIGGRKKNATKIIASCDVTAIKGAGRRSKTIDPVDVLTDAPASIVQLGNTKLFKQPTDFRMVLDKLEICPMNKTKWGSILIGGVRKISNNDYKTLVGTK